MDSIGTLELLAVLIGAGGIGGIVTAVVQARIASKRAPTEAKNLSLDGNLTLVSAAEKIVGSQSSVIEQRDAEIDELKDGMSQVKDQIQRVLDDLQNEKMLREEREAEAERLRLHIAKLESTMRSQSARIASLKRYLRSKGFNPDHIDEIEEEE